MNWLLSLIWPEPESSYKGEKEFEERNKLSTKALTKFPKKVPVIVDYMGPLELRNNLNRIQLVNRNMLATRFIEIVKNHYFKDNSDDDTEAKPLILFINGNRRDTRTDRTFEYLYDKFKDTDGFLYVKVNEH